MADYSLVVISCPTPNGDRYAVLPDEVSDVTESGLVVVKEHVEKPHTGTVVAVGSDVANEDGSPARIGAGDRVYHGRFAGIAIDVEVAGETEAVEVIFLRKDEIIAFEEQSDDDLPF